MLRASKTTALVVLVHAAALILGIALLAGPAAAQDKPPYYGTICTAKGPPVFDEDLRTLLDHFIPTYQSTLLVFTQCYGGDFLDNFEGRANTAAMSASAPGKVAYYGGYDKEAGEALFPGAGRTSAKVHEAGSASTSFDETPMQKGDPVSLEDTSAEGPVKSRHVVFFAGQPHKAGLDADQRNQIEKNFAGKANTTVTTLGGSPGTDGKGQNGWDLPGTLDGLKEALKDIGQQMNADEQFIMFVSDHGDRHKAYHDFEVDDTAMVTITLNLDTALLEDMLIEEENDQGDSGAGISLLADRLPFIEFDEVPQDGVKIELDSTGAVNGTPSLETIDLDNPDNPTGAEPLSWLHFSFSEDELIPWEPENFPVDEFGRVPIVFYIENNMGMTLNVHRVTFDSGPIGKPVPPGPLTAGQVSTGPNPPSSSTTAAPGEIDVELIQLQLTPTISSAIDIDGFQLAATGTGDDAADLQSVDVWEDVTGNGIIDTSAILLGSGQFSADNGTTLLNLTSPHRVGHDAELLILVTATLATDLDARALPAGLRPDTPGSATAVPYVLAFLLPITLLGAGWRRFRGIAAVLLLASGLLWFQACGTSNRGGGPQPQAQTYQVSVTGVEATRVDSGAAVTFDGLPIAGTTLSAGQ